MTRTMTKADQGRLIELGIPLTLSTKSNSNPIKPTFYLRYQPQIVLFTLYIVQRQLNTPECS